MKKQHRLVSLFLLLFLLGACTSVPKKTASTVNTAETEASTSVSTSSTVLEESNSVAVTESRSAIAEAPADVTKIIEAISAVSDTTIQSIEIYTPEANSVKSNQDKIYIIEATGSDDAMTHYLYLSNPKKLIEINEHEYNGKRQGIVHQNDSETPYYEQIYPEN
ncbi:hypothetical protein IGI37_001533 [Enterococcus sp. AZ194]|uniref:hypothetical protein n=1 Tax=Enterococcus sp. AZ194 TaxID=2774629 RepID=UPI003F24A6A7